MNARQRRKLRRKWARLLGDPVLDLEGAKLAAWAQRAIIWSRRSLKAWERGARGRPIPCWLCGGAGLSHGLEGLVDCHSCGGSGESSTMAEARHIAGAEDDPILEVIADVVYDDLPAVVGIPAGDPIVF